MRAIPNCCTNWRDSITPLGESEHEVEIYNRINAIDPGDAAAMRLGKEASARDSMKSGGWGAAESYRDLIKDKEAAVSLEQQSRMRLTGESLASRSLRPTRCIRPNHRMSMQRGGSAALSEAKDDLEAAIAWYRYASDLTHRSDPGLVRKISDPGGEADGTRDHSVRGFLSRNSASDPVLLVQKNAALAAARKRRAEMLIEEARKRFERNPTDLQFRFELGEHLMNAGHFRDALPELQRARQNPNARLKAMNALGQCYRELGMFDLAARQLEEAAREIATMDGIKKEIVYNLGLVYERMGNREKSLACMKQIYEADYGYKDVATRVESSYAAGS